MLLYDTLERWPYWHGYFVESEEAKNSKFPLASILNLFKKILNILVIYLIFFI